MKHTPCEDILWNLVPAIRNEIASSMVNDFGLTQKETAIKLDITPAAVCFYLSHKRGNFEIRDKKIIKEIQNSAENIIKDENIDCIKEICRICKIIKSRRLFPISNLKT
jgi:predicted transcriptional regulator